MKSRLFLTTMLAALSAWGSQTYPSDGNLYVGGAEAKIVLVVPKQPGFLMGQICADLDREGRRRVVDVAPTVGRRTGSPRATM